MTGRVGSCWCEIIFRERGPGDRWTQFAATVHDQSWTESGEAVTSVTAPRYLVFISRYSFILLFPLWFTVLSLTHAHGRSTFFRCFVVNWVFRFIFLAFINATGGLKLALLYAVICLKSWTIANIVTFWSHVASYFSSVIGTYRPHKHLWPDSYTPAWSHPFSHPRCNYGA